MLYRILLTLFLLLFVQTSIAQTSSAPGGTSYLPGIGVHGTITPGDCGEWYNSTTLEDSGATCGGGGGSGTVTSSGSPVSGNIPKFTTATNIAPAAASDIIALFTGCSGTQYLGADGNCHNNSSAPAFSAITSGTNTSAAMIVGSGATISTTGTGTGAFTPVVVPFTTGSKTLAIGDENTIQDCNSASAQTITIPTNASVAFDVGSVINIEQNGAGAVTINTASGVTLNGVTTTGTFTIGAQYSGIYLRKEATNTWYIEGTSSAAGVSSFSGDGTILSNSLSAGAVTATLVNAGAGTVLGNATSSSAAPTYTATPQLGKSGTLGSITMGNATSGLLTLEPVTGALGTVTGSLPANSGTVSELNLQQAFTADQSVAPTTLSISTATFTPTKGSSNNFNITLVHGSCPCTIANPSGTINAGDSGMFVINQSSSGSDTIGTWGNEYLFTGGTPPTLSTGASAIDVLPYYAIDSTHIAVGFQGNMQTSR